MDSQTSESRELEMAHLLFMDIVGFSRLPTDQQPQLLAELQYIVTHTDEYQRAHEVQKLIALPTGDGMVLAFFSTPEAPARCALEIARALADRPHIPLRMGVHTGPVYRVRDVKGEENVAGDGINMAQRVMDCGDAGHILLSHTSREVLVRLSAWAPDISDLGETEVKHGVRIHVYNLHRQPLGNPDVPSKLQAALGLRRPSARTPLSAGRPLPPHPDLVHPYSLQEHFTGRVRERTMLTDWFRNDNKPFLTVIGIGGQGKSSLTWVWTHRDVMGYSLPGLGEEPESVAAACRVPEEERPEGVLWWSYYERGAGFPAFLNEAIIYASGGAERPSDAAPTFDKVRLLVDLLQNRRLLIVWDGFEREVRAYAGPDAAFQGDAVLEDRRGDFRVCVDPFLADFLRMGAALPLASRLLITSRVYPRELDGLAGSRREDLPPLAVDDVVAFFHAQGVRGTRAEIQAACETYGYHPLTLRLLAGMILKHPRSPGDITAAGDYDPLPHLVQRRNHILALAYESLRPPVRELLSLLAAFRSSVNYDTVQAVFGREEGIGATFRRLLGGRQTVRSVSNVETGLQELVERGLVFFDGERYRYDLHPVVRAYAYSRLADKVGVESRLREYFVTIRAMDEEDIQSREDITPVSELYQHTVRAKQFDRAAALYYDRLDGPLRRFGPYRTMIELLRELLPDLQASPLREKDQARVLFSLGTAYGAFGQPRRAEPMFQRQTALAQKMGDKRYEALALQQHARLIHLPLCQLREAEQGLTRSIALFRDAADLVGESDSHREFARLMAYEGNVMETKRRLEAAAELLERSGEVAPGPAMAYTRAECALRRGDAAEALEAARQARLLAYKERCQGDIVWAEWLVGAALVALAARESPDRDEALGEAEEHLAEAFSRCRDVNLVEREPDILLARARWQRARGNTAEAKGLLNDALKVTRRCGYRLVEADIHLLLAEIAFAAGDRNTARQQVQIAAGRAYGTGPPHRYHHAAEAAKVLLQQCRE